MLSRLPCTMAILAIGALSTVLGAQPLVPPAVQAPQPQTAEPAAADAPPPQPEPPDSPRASLRAYFDAARSGRWADAARYLKLDGQQPDRGPELAERLEGVLDHTGWIGLDTISASPAGRLDDGLPPELEEIRQFTLGEQTYRVYMERATDDRGAFWAFSAATVSRIDEWYASLPNRWLRDLAVSLGFDSLLRPGPFELLWWQWLAVPFLLLVAWAVGRAFGAITLWLVARVTSRTRSLWDDRFVQSLGPPLTLLWSLAAFRIGARQLVLTEPASRFIGTVTRGVVVFALFWALWRCTRVIVDRIMLMSWALTSPSARSLMAVGSNLARAGIVVLGLLAVLAALGYPVGTVVAGLGIGGLALAFGAQKTVENVFGSISLAVDQPFRVGDFVKVEDFVGTVEEIGLRSTRIRTLDRTLVSIPNGKLADQRLESFEARDRMRLATTIGLTYSTTRAQMQTVLEGFEQVLRGHPDIWPDAVVVRFKEFGPSSLDIEIMAWFKVPTWADFQRCRQDVLIGFMKVVEEAGASFAFPTRTVHLVREDAVVAPDDRVRQ